MKKCGAFWTCVCIIWTMDSGFCMFISFVMDKVFTNRLQTRWHWFNCWAVVRVLKVWVFLINFVLFLFVWGGRKVLSTNVLHNLYQKQTKKRGKNSRGGLDIDGLSNYTVCEKELLNQSEIWQQLCLCIMYQNINDTPLTPMFWIKC